MKEYHPSEIPAKPGVYAFRDLLGQVIYVGKAVNLRRRLGNYFQPARSKTADVKLRSLIKSIADWSYTVVNNEDEALILESQLIKTYAPHYNILMRDDKRYPLLRINLNDRYPTISLARLKKPGNNRYFGPFPHGSALNLTREFLLSYFGLRGCRTPEPNAETRKHCLKRLVKDCCAPCTGQITPEEYRKKLEAALQVLDGDTAAVKAAVTQKMTEAATAQKYEQAAKLRDVLFNLDAVFGAKNRNFSRPELPDRPFSFARGVETLQERLHLAVRPRTIVCFDISNILGTLAVASMVTFTDGKPDRAAYRRFRIKTVFQSNDFAMMHEAVSRHFRRQLAEAHPLPDLVIVDGGAGQLSSGIAALEESGCGELPIIGLAERNEEIYLPDRETPLVLDRHDPALKLIQALRDEAHRFAITYHRTLREKRIQSSILDDIAGIGGKRKIALLRKCGSIAGLRRMNAAEISAAVPSINTALAQNICDALKK